MSYKEELLSLRKEFSNLNIPKEKEAFLVSIYNIYKFHNVKIEENILKTALNYEFVPKNYNDYYYIATLAYLHNNYKLVKIAYPNGQGALMEDLKEPFDLEKWIGLVHKIYDAVHNNEMSYEFALDYYSGELSDSNEERAKFKEWVKYYKNGEHLKYKIQANRRNKMKKEADFQFPLSGSGFYPNETQPIKNKELSIERAKSKDDFSDWKNKLYVAIRRLDKLLRQGDSHMNEEVHADLADLLHAFDMEVRKVRMASTASDMTKRAALAFKAKGLNNYANELYSLAQEAPIAPEIDPTPDDMIGDPISDENEIEEDFSNNQTSNSPIGTALQSGPGPKPGEYEALSGTITLETASKKLEEIAGRLADRRVVRLLAEFDIMLDQLGVAPMFPELAEAQSKLIDAYSYAITRVTKMLGMLSSGKNIAEISGAKEQEIQKSIDKEVSKTFNPEKETEPKGTPAINEEFAQNQVGEDRPKPAPLPPENEEV